MRSERSRAIASLLALAAAAFGQTPAPPARTALPFVEDDYGKALGQARARDLPLFVEAWAPW
ncbi:MAG: hypothetical protein ACRD3M_14840 [Thermoanaerobaculia bacterium]